MLIGTLRVKESKWKKLLKSITFNVVTDAFIALLFLKKNLSISWFFNQYSNVTYKQYPKLILWIEVLFETHTLPTLFWNFDNVTFSLTDWHPFLTWSLVERTAAMLLGAAEIYHCDFVYKGKNFTNNFS